MAIVNKTTVIDIYTGVLGLLPPKSAIDWLTSAEYAGKPLDVAANLVLDAFKSRYSTGVDDANLLSSASDVNFVKAVYARIFGLSTTELATQSEGVTYWTSWLKNPSAGADATNNYRGSLISTMLDAALDKTQHVGDPVVEKARALLANREAVSEHYLQKGGADADQSWLRKVIGDVTENTSSVESAKTVINGKTAAPGSEGVITGTAGDDLLYAEGNVTLNALGGDNDLYDGGYNVVLNGGASYDTYYLSFQGEVIIHDAGGPLDSISLNGCNSKFGGYQGHGGVSLAMENLSCKHSGNDLVLTAIGEPGTVTIVDFYKQGHAVEYIEWFAGDIGFLNLIGVANSLTNGASVSDLSDYFVVLAE
jgi:hypothetical protein